MTLREREAEVGTGSTSKAAEGRRFQLSATPNVHRLYGAILVLGAWQRREAVAVSRG